MDLRCTVCGEPWDMDEVLHEQYLNGVKLAPGSARKRFQRLGCEAMDSKHNESPDTEAAMIAQTLGELLGDDVDGLAAMLEDWEWFNR